MAAPHVDRSHRLQDDSAAVRSLPLLYVIRSKGISIMAQGVITEGMDPSEVAAVKQLSREVLILEMLKSELLERNARLERWHAEHPRTSTSQSGSSQALRDTCERANAGAPGGTSKPSTFQPLPPLEAAPPRASSRGRESSMGDRRGGSLLPR